MYYCLVLSIGVLSIYRAWVLSTKVLSKFFFAWLYFGKMVLSISPSLYL